MFKRKIALAGLCVGLFSSQAFSEGFFIGTEMGVLNSSGKNTYNTQFTGSNETTGKDELQTAFHKLKGSNVVFNPSIKLGYVINEFNRVYGLYSYNTANSNRNFSMPFHKFALAYELTPQISGNFRGVLGFNVGYATGKYKGKKYSETDREVSDGTTNQINTKTFNYRDFSTQNNGFVYGAKIGGLYEIDSNSEIEFGFKAEQVRFKGKTQEIGGSYKEVTGDYTPIQNIDGIVATARNKPRFTNYGVYIGYNYKF